VNQKRLMRLSFRLGCRRAAQPLHESHPHLIGPGELTVGIKQTEYVERRRAFFASMPDNAVLVLPGAVRPTKTHDILWPFRQESNFWFLTGFEEPNAIAIFEKIGGRNRFVMFCLEATAHSKVWDGPRAGTAGARTIFGADEAYPRDAYKEHINKIMSALPASTSLFLKKDVVPEVDDITTAVKMCQSATTLLQRMRSVKSPAVLHMMQRTADITKKCFEFGMGCTSPGRSEHHVHAVMDFAAQLSGAQRLAYVPVIAGGRNALALHYIENTALLKEGDLLMVDAGAEYHYYPTDCSRTWPVNGIFSAPQRRLYEAVLRVQNKLIAKVTAGQQVSIIQKLSEDLLLEELLSLGIISHDLPEEKRRQRLGVVYPHAWGHFMGLDIHERVEGDVFVEGMMHTVEPGVYIPQGPLFPEEFWNLGFRIEDNVVVTKGAPVITTGHIPKTVEEIEGTMRDWKDHPLQDLVKNCCSL